MIACFMLVNLVLIGTLKYWYSLLEQCVISGYDAKILFFLKRRFDIICIQLRITRCSFNFSKVIKHNDNANYFEK